MIRIIHISDLHLESENPSHDKRNIIKALGEDLTKYVNEETILFFTGDLIDKGGIYFSKNKNPFEEFESIFINKILSITPILKERIFVVPGNHDVVRSRIDPISEAGLKSSINDVGSLHNFIEKNRFKSSHLDRLDDYKLWEKSFYEKYANAELSNFENTFIVNIGNNKVGVTCANSSWMCKDENDKENILLGKGQIEKSIDKISDCQIKLILFHHPLEFFRDFDKESSKLLIHKHYDILFTGHVHELSSSYSQDLFGDIFISIANSTIGDSPKERKHINGYTIIDLFPNELVRATYRKYIETHDKFVSNTDIGTEDGIKEFRILKEGKLESFEKNSLIVSNIETRYAEKLSEHFIMAGGTTNANCSIDTLFVEPTILNTPHGSIKETGTVKYTVDDIICSSSNFLIYGLKESGKTILLDKMFLDSITKFNQINKIPVYLKFMDIKRNNVKKAIREFISISSDKIDDYLRENNIILFIDDFSFSEKYSEQLSSLKEFIRIYDKVQLIITSDQILENVVPTDYLEHNTFFDFNISFIQNFNSNEIKQLVTKWFAGKEINLQENMEKLIKSFVDFGLPKTPLSVTLFLWIFEKQEKRPINNSVLVEMFIENILEKTNAENIYRETFDFKNKQRLLSFISKFMHDNGNEDLSYSVDYVELLAFINKYLKTRFPGKPQKVLDDLIGRGILCYEDDNLIRFKSAFFFQYFIAIHFDYNKEFKEFVFSEENYLDYVDEIIYYTGLKRDDIEILSFTQNKLDYAFKDFNNSIRENYQKIDEVLEVKDKKNTVTFEIEEKKSSIKPDETQIEEMYDKTLSNIPVQKNIPKKEKNNLDTRKNLDQILRLSSVVLKNSEDVDDFDYKVDSYERILSSSISFLMLYRNSLIAYYNTHKKQPEQFPKNIDFFLFIRILPLMHQVVIFNWIGSQKIRPVIEEKMRKDILTTNVSEFEKFMSAFIYSDIKGSDYPETIKNFVKNAKYNYSKDLSFLKIMSYYHLRPNSKELDQSYLKLMSEIKQDLGHIDKRRKTQYMQAIADKKKKRGNN